MSLSQKKNSQAASSKGSKVPEGKSSKSKKVQVVTPPVPNDPSVKRWVIVQLSSSGEREKNISQIIKSARQILSNKTIEVCVPAVSQKVRDDSQTMFYWDGYVFVEYQEGVQYLKLNETSYFQSVLVKPVSIGSRQKLFCFLSDKELDPMRRGLQNMKIGEFGEDDKVKIIKGQFKNLLGEVSVVYDGNEFIQVSVLLRSKKILIDFPASYLVKTELSRNKMRKIGGPETKRNILVDGNNLIHRAYFAFVDSRVREGKEPYTTLSGYPTGMVYGSLSMLSSWLYDMGDITNISVFFDGVPKRRLAIDPDYKGDRDFAERGLKLSNPSRGTDRKPKRLSDGFEANCEVDILAHLFSLIGCDVYHHPEEEADDLVASFVQKNPQENNIIVSDDKDFFQLLVNPRVTLYRPGSKDGKFFDAERAKNHWTKFGGGSHPAVDPAHVRMFKSLCGDSSDSIFGIDRLRKKVAVPLCHLPTVDDIYASGFPGWSKAEKEKALFLRNRIKINYELVGFHDYLDLESCRRQTVEDYVLAKRIISDDLNIRHLDLQSFRFRDPPPGLDPKREEGLTLPSWLLDI